ncbi:Uncharacterized protein TPAR_06004 [Tolypocladium paradoxum]|uniref:DUF6546 domain-containing protein n=1 Tax=Tolypocladium paradoxum TaxID=94208 RepID=A0A2S4KUE6_9HYPO|nr:Uncharacterized protein TPAR_06004 [Tolypocladium paradoxum]
MPGWEVLPLEIHQMTLQLVVRDHDPKLHPRALSGYASVCQLWRFFFEQHTFMRLLIRPSCLPSFGQIVCNDQQRLSHLQELWFLVDLANYGCKSCKRPENKVTMESNEAAFTKALWDLLQILSLWTRSGWNERHPKLKRKGEDTMMLYLGAYSRSDSKHVFRDFRLQDGYPFRFPDLSRFPREAYIEYERTVSKLTDHFHGWKRGRSFPALGAKKRLFGARPLGLNFRGVPNPPDNKPLRFPRVDKVTGLTISRQYYRGIGTDVLGKLFKESLRRLRWFRHEQWRGVDTGSWNDLVIGTSKNKPTVEYGPKLTGCSIGYRDMLLNHMPKRLGHLNLFEDFNWLLHKRTSISGMPIDASLGRALAESSRGLETLTASFIVDAIDFFHEFRPGHPRPSTGTRRPWKKLRYLALTSPTLDPELPEGPIQELLIAAGEAAQLMPSLELMEIWNGGLGYGCFFRYVTIDGVATLTWQCSWDGGSVLVPGLVAVWERVAGKLPLAVQVRQFPQQSQNQDVSLYMDTLRQLLLKGHILNDIARYQVYYEGARNCIG